MPWLSQQTGKTYRLPTETEWEFAVRAGSTTACWWGDDISQNNAVCNGCRAANGIAIKRHQSANSFGLYDTAGNVWKWTQDCWHENYQNAPEDGSAWLEAGGDDCGRRVVRGASIHMAFVRLTVTGASPLKPSTSSVFVSPGFCRLVLCALSLCFFGYGKKEGCDTCLFLLQSWFFCYNKQEE